jgi:hypothetical protein
MQPLAHRAMHPAAGLLLCMIMLWPKAAPSAEAPAPRGWLAAGIGSAWTAHSSSSPASGNQGFAWSVEGGRWLSSRLGVGIEVGSNVVQSFARCGLEFCNSGAQDLKRGKSFDHLYAVADYRPVATGWRLRLAAGVLQYCWGTDIDGVCHTKSALGIGASVARFWRLRGEQSLGLRLGTETAHFGAGVATNQTPFAYRATLLSLQWSLD